MLTIVQMSVRGYSGHPELSAMGCLGYVQKNPTWVINCEDAPACQAEVAVCLYCPAAVRSNKLFTVEGSMDMEVFMLHKPCQTT